MTDIWEIWLDDPEGTRLALLDTVISGELTRNVSKLGAFEVNLPFSFGTSQIRKDGLVEFWYGAEVGAMSCLGVGKIRRRGVRRVNGVDVIRIAGPDFMDQLQTRRVAYASGSSQASKTGYADDVMKAIVRENLGSSAGTGRDLSGLNFSVAPDVSLGPSVTKMFSRRNVLDVLSELGDMAAELGTRVYYDLNPVFYGTGQIGFVFDTFVGQRGMDRRAGTAMQTVFGDTWGNLEDPELEYDDWDEANFAYIGGQGQGDDRAVETVSNVLRIGESVWNRRELWVDARDTDDASVMQDRGYEELWARRPKRRFSGRLLSTPSSQYGVDWAFGDLITAEYMGEQFDGMIKTVRWGLQEDGSTRIEAKLEVDE
jgi:hypothetical protein